MSVLVLGAGVSGLTTAVRLREAGLDVHVVTREPPEETTSAAAAAIWYPYLADPRDRVLVWAQASLPVFYELAEAPDTGVRIIELIEVVSEPVDPWWRSAVRRFTWLGSDEVPAGHRAAFRVELPVIASPRYLSWLQDRLLDLGGSIEVEPDGLSLDEAAARAPTVVNATGVMARFVADDPEVFPVRGQVVVVEDVGDEVAWLDESGQPTYVIPRGSDCVLGTTVERGTWSRDPEEATTASILERTASLVPAVAGRRQLAVKVGLRPGRSQVRVAREVRPDGAVVIHNYGHGGAGFTLSWGCADEVVQLASPEAQAEG